MSRHPFPAVLTALLVAALGTLPLPAHAQSTELLFSEYIEGTSNNKALEIYNGTGAAVNLAAGGYNVQMHFNGNPVATLTIPLNGTVAAGDVYVLAQSGADAAILAVADQTNGSGWFNGDDAVVLRKGTTVIDVIGQIGFDPGTEWGTGLASTADNTLRRQMAITVGDPVGSDPFSPAVEWTGFATNNFDGLGCHNGELACSVPPPTDAEIWEVQGAGLVSPFAGKRVRITNNVVTAVFADGFFMQAPAPGDGNAETSDGLFVFTSSAPTVTVGDQVGAIGMVAEFFNMTELDADAVTRSRSGLASPAAVTFDALTPSPNQPQPANEMERFEGMLVRVVNGTVSSPTNEFGEASVVAAPRRVFREPGILFPGLPDLPVWDGNPEIFEIDTDRFAAAPRALLSGGTTVTAGGPLAFSFGDYQIWPTTLDVSGNATVVPVRARNAGEFTVGSQNVLRLFDATDDPELGNRDEPILSAEEYAERLAKLSLHVRQALGSPDVLAVQEVENLQALQDLAGRIQADSPDVIYTAYVVEGNDIGGIDVGFLVRDSVRVDAVEQLGRDDQFTFGGTTTDLNDRPPLLLRGAYMGNGAPFPIAVINVHQRSLSGIDSPGDGARVRQKRHQQAVRLAEFIEGVQSAQPDVKLVVIGDFNAFEFTDGYVDVMGQVTGKPDAAGALLPTTDVIGTSLTNQTLNMAPEQRYSFVFDGTAQSLDHAITSQALDPWVREAQHSRGNADAPRDFDVDASTPLRSSDHDGTVLFLMSDADGDGVADDNDACAATVVPERVPTVRLVEKHFALVNSDRTFDTPTKHAAGVFTLDDTRGCSCEQILERVERGTVGQRNIGCSLDTITNWIGPRP